MRKYVIVVTLFDSDTGRQYGDDLLRTVKTGEKQVWEELDHFLWRIDNDREILLINDADTTNENKICAEILKNKDNNTTYYVAYHESSKPRWQDRLDVYCEAKWSKEFHHDSQEIFDTLGEMAGLEDDKRSACFDKIIALFPDPELENNLRLLYCLLDQPNPKEDLDNIADDNVREKYKSKLKEEGSSGALLWLRNELLDTRRPSSG